MCCEVVQHYRSCLVIKWWFQTISELCTTRAKFSHLAATCSRCCNTSASACVYTRPWARVETSGDADGVASRFKTKEASFEARYESRFFQSDIVQTRVWRCGTQFKTDWWYMVMAPAGDALCYLPCCRPCCCLSFAYTKLTAAVGGGASCCCNWQLSY